MGGTGEPRLELEELFKICEESRDVGLWFDFAEGLGVLTMLLLQGSFFPIQRLQSGTG